MDHTNDFCIFPEYALLYRIILGKLMLDAVKIEQNK